MTILQRQTVLETGGSTAANRGFQGFAGFKHFLEALGYRQGDCVYLRTLPPKGFEPEHYEAFPALTYTKADGTRLPAGKKFRIQGNRLWWITKYGERLAGDAWEALQAENAKGFGVYIIPNPGGHADADITGSRVIFWEDDERSKAEQLARFDEQRESWGGGIAIETKNSIHSYFRHDEFIDPLDFAILQKRVIREFDSDASIWNPSRLMRVPGFDHTSIVDGAIVRFPVTIARRWDGEVTKYAWIDNSLPAPTSDDIDSVLRCGKKSAAIIPIPVSDDPCDPRNWAQLLPDYAQKGNGWAQAAIPAPGVTSNNGFQVRLEDGAINIFSGTVTRKQGIEAAIAYVAQKDFRVSLAGYWCWFWDIHGESSNLPESPSSGGGFAVIDGGKTKPRSKRERAIDWRNHCANQVLPLLEKDYKITRKNDGERDVCYYEGRTPEFSQALIDGIPTVLVRGGLGAGKTHAAIESLAQAIAAAAIGKQIIWITGRNGLLRQTEQRLLKRLRALGVSVYHFQDDVKLHGDLLRNGEPGIYCLCPESLSDYHAVNIDWTKCIVIIDEFAAIRKSVVSKPKVLPQFKTMLSEARQLVVMDAFLGDADCRVLSRFRKGERLILDQVPDKAPKRVKVVECRTKDGDIALSHDGVAFDVLDKWFKGKQLAEDERYIVVTDSLLSAKVCKLYAQSLGLAEHEVMLICSETIELTHQVMPDPDEAIKQRKAKLVIFTPTVESGLDVQLPFTEGLGLFCGVVPGTSALQLIGRARQCNDWIVSAPRRSINPDAPHMTEAKLKKIIERLQAETIEESGMEGDERSDGWAVWEREIGALLRAYNSEFIAHLLREHYESVAVTEEFTFDNRGWMEYVTLVKTDEAIKILRGNLENGQTMLQEEKTPIMDSHVWDIKLAKGFQQHPKPWQQAIDDYQSGDKDRKDEAIAWAKALLKHRELWALKRYVQAVDLDLDDDNALNDRVSRAGCSYAAPAFKQLQMQSLFRQLDLETLAKLERGGKVTALDADSACYDARSAIIESLWKKFKGDARLSKLFPNIETIKDFWRVIKSCMRYFGFDAVGGQQRVARDGYREATPSIYLVGWVIRCESGSKFLVNHFDIIIESIRDRLEVERLEYRRRASHSPPDEDWGVAA
jgi:hypothetical protein